MSAVTMSAPVQADHNKGEGETSSPAIAYAIAAVPALVLLIVSLARYRNGHGTIDLAILDQVLWKLSHLRSPDSSVLLHNILGDHFSPAILVFALPYRIAATPVWLLVGQAAAAYVAVVLILRRLRTALPPVQAGLLGAAILASPPVAYAVLFDVHPVVFAVPFALAAVFAAEDGHAERTIPLALLAAAFRFEIGLAALVALVVLRRRHIGGTALAKGPWILGAYLAFAYVMEGRLAGGASHWAGHFDHLGSSPMDVLAHPWRVVLALVAGATVAKVLPWLVSCGLTGLNGGVWLLPAAAASLAVLLSEWPGTASWQFHYGYAPTLLLALAWLPAVKREPWRWQRVAAGCTFLALLVGPVVPSVADLKGVSVAGAAFSADGGLACVASGLPPGAGVSADSWAIAGVAHRDRLYLWPFPFAAAGTTTLPNEDLQTARPDLAAEVDYVIVSADVGAGPPPGFAVDVVTQGYVRWRRLSSVAAPSTCNPPDLSTLPRD